MSASKKQAGNLRKWTQNAPGEGGRRVQNEGPEGFWALPGAMWAQGGRRERLKSLLAAARGRPGGQKNSCSASWGPLGAES